MSDAPEWQQSTLKRAEISAIAGLGYPLMRTLGITGTARTVGPVVSHTWLLAGLVAGSRKAGEFATSVSDGTVLPVLAMTA